MMKYPMIRILPMSKEEFEGKTIEKVQNYFFWGLDNEDNEYGLPLRDGNGYGCEKGCYFWYKTKGMQSISGTLVLFQYDNKIIASAELIGSTKFERPQTCDGEIDEPRDWQEGQDDEDKKYCGTYCFDRDSIKIFEPPLDTDDIRSVWSEKFKSFSHVKWDLDTDKYQEFYDRFGNRIRTD